MNTRVRFTASVAALATALLFSGCSTPIVGQPDVRYSYDPTYSFQQANSYGWADAGSPYGRDPLLEANVRFLADRLLQAKGLTPKPDAPALRISVRYDTNGYSQDLRSLSLNVARADNNSPVWRGVTTGSIRPDATSGDLSAAVEAMLANFPPKVPSDQTSSAT